MQAYTAKLSQNFDSNPSAIIANSNQPDFLGDIEWKRFAVGNFEGKKAGAFPETETKHTVIFIGSLNFGFSAHALRVDDDTIQVYTRRVWVGFADQEASFEDADGLLNETAIKIEVYGNQA
jgi:hypothetical protein